MTSKACEQILTAEIVYVAFEKNQSTLSGQIISCFYSCYRPQFIQWAKIAYAGYPVDTVEFLADSSFTDGVLKFKEAAASGKLYQGPASVKTVLFQYCLNILRGHLTTEKRLAAKSKRLQIHTENEDASTEQDPGETMFRMLMLALDRMSPDDRQIIQWRHIEQKTTDEIAALLAINVNSTTNRIYRCMERLRKEVKKIETS